MMRLPISQVGKEMDTRDAKEEGRIEGKKEGKMEVAENLLRNGVSLYIVAESTGLGGKDVFVLTGELRKKCPAKWVPASQVRQELYIRDVKRDLAKILLKQSYRMDLIIKNLELDEEDLLMLGWSEEE